MRKRRLKAKRDRDLTNGPGKLTAAMQVDGMLDGVRLDGKLLWLEERDIDVRDEEIGVSKRVGVESAIGAAHWPLRFFLRGNQFVSGSRLLNDDARLSNERSRRF
jgi:DNA-3-methyladenine glycosylase